MRLLFFLTIIVLSRCSFSCVEEATDQYTRKLKPYDPEKAGAVIVESFDLTDNGLVPRISVFNDIAEYNDCIYLRVGDRLYIFEKETLLKRRELWINFPSIIGIYSSRGLAAVNDDTAFLLCRLDRPNNPSGYRLVSIDLSTGNALIINDEKELGYDLKQGNPLMGYNKENDSVWFLIDITETDIYVSQYLYQLFQYNKDTQNFTALETTKEFMPGISPYISVEGASVYGNEIWNTAYEQNRQTGKPIKVGIEKRNIDNPDEVLHFIDVEYLGTLTIPQSIIYDNPYIWMLAERDNQVQMLKLLPNG